MYDVTFEQSRLKAEAFKAIGQTRFYLMTEPFPWHLATHCDPGSTHRLDMATSARFYARDDEFEFTYEWSFDLEKRSANGKPYYEIDDFAIKRVMTAIPEAARKSFREYLTSCYQSVHAKALEWERTAKNQRELATQLSELSNWSVPR